MSENSTKEKYSQWYRLDNAAVIFSLISSSELPSLFRMTVELFERINVSILQKSLERVIGRFPYFQVTMEKGIFWFYWEEKRGNPKVISDSRYPCEEMPIYEKNVLPFRVRAFNNRIAVEFHHAITDGTGALTFLKSLLAEYLVKSGKKITDFGDIFRPDQEPDLEEYEDAFKRYVDTDLPNVDRLDKAFQLPYKRLPDSVYHITTGVVDIEELKTVTKEHGDITISEFLVAIYLHTLQEVFYTLPEKQRNKLKDPIRVSIAVNLRNIYPSETLRNFSLHVLVGINPKLGKYSFEEIIKEVHHTMQIELNDKYISQQIRRNVIAEMHPLMRIMPLFLKRLFGKIMFVRYGESQFSGAFTNLGLINFPDDIQKHVKSFQFIPSPNGIRKVTMAVSGFKSKLYINFGRVCENKIVERLFFTKLAEMGVNIRISTNFG